MLKIISTFSSPIKRFVGRSAIAIAGLCLIFCQPKDQVAGSEHSLYGIWDDVKDGTWIFLEIGDRIDSIRTVDGQFTFDLSQYKIPKWALIRTEGYKHYKFFWTDEKDINFTIDYTFDRVHIKGSKTNDTYDSLSNVVDPLVSAMDSMKRLLSDSTPKTPEIYEKITDLERDLRHINTKFIHRHSSDVLGVFTLSSTMLTLNTDTVKRLFGEISKNLSDTEYYQDVSSFIELHADVSIGKRYTDFTQDDPDGKLIRLSQFEGKVVLLEFWASWCTPCRRHNPELVRIFREYHDKGFEILSVSLDSKKDKWIGAIMKDSLTWYHVRDENGSRNKAAVIYGVSRIPQSFLIDRNGVIIAKDLRGKALEVELGRVLAASSSVTATTKRHTALHPWSPPKASVFRGNALWRSYHYCA